jgi:hypothetical protein
MIKTMAASDTISALDAKFEAQKIAFSPLCFQAVRSLLEFGILRKVSDAEDEGLSREEIADSCGISLYGAGILAEMALGMKIFHLNPLNSEKFILGKTGWFLLEDEMTRVNLNFVNDVCYEGAFQLAASIKSGKPEGLFVFDTEKSTIYDALSALPTGVRKSWFDFDHFYSDIAFDAALPVVFGDERPPKILFDIGGNTAKWAIRCCMYDPDVNVSVVDLPGQTASAEKNAAEAGFSARISAVPCDILDEASVLPSGADAIWMSQFLDCFSLDDVKKIMEKIAPAAGAETDIIVLEPFWDMQRFEASSYSLRAASLYFTCMANGKSKFYRAAELCGAIESAGFTLKDARHNLGANSSSLLNFRKTA